MMKKFLLITIIITGAAKLHAQANFIKPVDSMAKGFHQLIPDLKWNDQNFFMPYFKMQKPGNLSNQNNDFKTVIVQPLVNNMPIAKLSSDDHMPVAKTEDGVTHYTMLVKKIALPDPVSKEKVVTP